MRDQICDAIRNKKIVDFLYENCFRHVEPHVFGRTNSITVLLGYQIGGESRSGGIPNWRMFYANNIQNLTVTDELFSGKRPTTGPHKIQDVDCVVD